MRKSLATMLVLAGCSGLSLPGSSPSANDQVMLAMKDVGAACAGLAVTLTPVELAKARDATAKATNVLASDSPTFAALKEVLTATNLPAKYVALAAIGVQIVENHTGGKDPLPKDSLAFQAASAFVATCGAQLGA